MYSPSNYCHFYCLKPFNMIQHPTHSNSFQLIPTHSNSFQLIPLFNIHSSIFEHQKNNSPIVDEDQIDVLPEFMKFHQQLLLQHSSFHHPFSQAWHHQKPCGLHGAASPQPRHGAPRSPGTGSPGPGGPGAAGDGAAAERWRRFRERKGSGTKRDYPLGI